MRTSGSPQLPSTASLACRAALAVLARRPGIPTVVPVTVGWPAHRWIHEVIRFPAHTVQPCVRALEHFRILLSRGSQDGEPFGEEPPGVRGSPDGHLPWETALREPSRLVQTRSRPTSHRGGRQAVVRSSPALDTSVDPGSCMDAGQRVTSPAIQSAVTSTACHWALTRSSSEGSADAVTGACSYAEMSPDLRCRSGNHLREPPCTLLQTP